MRRVRVQLAAAARPEVLAEPTAVAHDLARVLHHAHGPAPPSLPTRIAPDGPASPSLIASIASPRQVGYLTLRTTFSKRLALLVKLPAQPMRNRRTGAWSRRGSPAASSAQGALRASSGTAPPPSTAAEANSRWRAAPIRRVLRRRRRRLDSQPHCAAAVDGWTGQLLSRPTPLRRRPRRLNTRTGPLLLRRPAPRSAQRRNADKDKRPRE